MTLKKLLLVLCLIGFAGCEKREDKYIRLQREVADKQQELSSLIETINSLGKEPNIETCLSKREFALVAGSKLTEQIKERVKDGNEVEKSEIQTSVNQMVDIAIGGNALSEEQIADFKVSIASGLNLFKKKLIYYYHEAPVEMLRLNQRYDELEREIKELQIVIEAMEKT